MRIRSLYCSSCIRPALLALSIFTIINLFILLHVPRERQYDDAIVLPMDPKRGRNLGRLDYFDDLLSEYRSTLVNLTLFVVDEKVNHALNKVNRRVLHASKVDVEFFKKLVPLLKHQLEMQAAPSFLRNEPIINDHTFSYILNPYKTCSRNQTEILFTVPSAADNFERRKRVRNGNLGHFVRYAPNNAKLLFFVGRPPQNETYLQVQHKIKEESKMFGDMVQENFEDIYKNIRFKGVGMLKWASTFCSQTKYVIRADDDITVNASQITQAVKRTSEKFGDFVLGKMRFHDRPQRYPGKSFLSFDEYSPVTFPPYALGGLLGYPISTVRLLYQAALRLKPIWLDDVFVTGLCALKVNVPVMQDPEFVYGHVDPDSLPRKKKVKQRAKPKQKKEIKVNSKN